MRNETNKREKRKTRKARKENLSQRFHACFSLASILHSKNALYYLISCHLGNNSGFSCHHCHIATLAPRPLPNASCLVHKSRRAWARLLAAASLPARVTLLSARLATPQHCSALRCRCGLRKRRAGGLLCSAYWASFHAHVLNTHVLVPEPLALCLQH